MEKGHDLPILGFLKEAVSKGASDVHLSVGEVPRVRLDGQLLPADWNDEFSAVFSKNQAEQVAEIIFTDRWQQRLEERGSVDGALSVDQQTRFRFNAYKRSGEICFCFRHLPAKIPSLDMLGLDPALYNLCELRDGLILVAGPTGSGKSTTIASLIHQINCSRNAHIITIEDPVEFLHPSARCLVNQRQVGQDVDGFSQALKDALRQDPDVLLVGELRDIETIKTAITAAETGHLVFATVHSGDCKGAVERLVSAFSHQEQNLASRLVATVLRSVIVQHLLPVMDLNEVPVYGADSLANSSPKVQRSKRIAATEVMHVNSAIANLIATENLSQINSLMQTANEQGMWTLDDSLARLWKNRKISHSTAKSLARNPEMLPTLARGKRSR